MNKIRYAIYENPTLIPVLMKDTSIKKSILYSELKKVLPCRIGIEFELSGCFQQGFIRKYKVKVKDKAADKEIAKFYGLHEVKCDFPSMIMRRNTPTDPNMDEPVPDNYIEMEPNYDNIVEVRVSLKDFHQLVGLYKFMEDLGQFCKLHEGGGIHIHLDMSMYKKLRDSKKEKEVFHYIRHRLDDVQKIFPTYTGKYNKKRVGLRSKATWLNISRLDTFEFRIAPLTFDYPTLIKWIRGCVSFRNDVIHHCKIRIDPSRAHGLNELPVGEVITRLYTELNDLDGRLDEYRIVNDNNTYTISYNDSNSGAWSVCNANANTGTVECSSGYIRVSDECCCNTPESGQSAV